MTHQWDNGDCYINLIVSTCKRCGAVRTRERREEVDYINTDGISIDMVGEVSALDWDYTDVPDDCPGKEGGWHENRNAVQQSRTRSL